MPTKFQFVQIEKISIFWVFRFVMFFIDFFIHLKAKLQWCSLKYFFIFIFKFINISRFSLLQKCQVVWCHLTGNKNRKRRKKYRKETIKSNRRIATIDYLWMNGIGEWRILSSFSVLFLFLVRMQRIGCGRFIVMIWYFPDWCEWF